VISLFKEEFRDSLRVLACSGRALEISTRDLQISSQAKGGLA
jgi:hypothetical protein